nr:MULTISPECIES: hypothetical protein [unclassified Xenorhabdus]
MARQQQTLERQPPQNPVIIPPCPMSTYLNFLNRLSVYRGRFRGELALMTFARSSKLKFARSQELTLVTRIMKIKK